MMNSNLACHSAGLSVHDILTDIELDSPAGHLAKPKHVCLLRSFLAQISIRQRWCNFHNKKENHKNTTLEWERTIAERSDNTREDLFAFICFHSFYQTAADTVRLILLLLFGRVDVRAWGGNSRWMVVVDGEKMGHAL
jgi:hypothetical protein